MERKFRGIKDRNTDVGEDKNLPMQGEHCKQLFVKGCVETCLHHAKLCHCGNLANDTLVLFWLSHLAR